MNAPLILGWFLSAVLLAACGGPTPRATVSSAGGSMAGGPVSGGPTAGGASAARADANGPLVRVTGPDGRVRPGVEVWLVDPREVQPERAVIASRTMGDWVAASRAIAAERVIADRSGEAQFGKARPAGFLVACEDGALFGTQERTASPRRGSTLDLRLAARRSYGVRLRDAQGNPAAGVPLTLAVPDPGSPARPFALPSTAVTDERGLATLYEPPPEATNILEGLKDIDDRVALLRVPASGLEPLALAGGGLVAEGRLPELGTLDVVCRFEGLAQDAFTGLIQVFPAADGSRSERTLTKRIEGGRASFTGVGSDEDLRAVIVLSQAETPERFVGTLTVEIDRDRSVGVTPMDERRFTVALDAGLLLEGRLVDVSGAPLADETVDLFVVGDAGTAWTVVTDGDGRFTWLLIRPGGKLARVVIGARSPRGRVIERLGAVSAGEVVDLGDLVIR